MRSSIAFSPQQLVEAGLACVLFVCIKVTKRRIDELFLSKDAMLTYHIVKR
jgi:hypothetical protein